MTKGVYKHYIGTSRTLVPQCAFTPSIGPYFVRRDKGQVVLPSRLFKHTHNPNTLTYHFIPSQAFCRWIWVMKDTSTQSYPPVVMDPWVTCWYGGRLEDHGKGIGEVGHLPPMDKQPQLMWVRREAMVMEDTQEVMLVAEGEGMIRVIAYSTTNFFNFVYSIYSSTDNATTLPTCL